eukprot:scaffold3350_cov268-Pinguiococcus_pyrenoidosus.AAC.6
MQDRLLVRWATNVLQLDESSEHVIAHDEDGAILTSPAAEKAGPLRSRLVPRAIKNLDGQAFAATRLEAIGLHKTAGLLTDIPAAKLCLPVRKDIHRAQDQAVSKPTAATGLTGDLGVKPHGMVHVHADALVCALLVDAAPILRA